MSSTPHPVLKICVVTTMFDHGGVTTYWKDVIEILADRGKWLFFVNKVQGVDQDPFKRANVEVIAGFIWQSPFRSSQNLIREILAGRPQSLIFNGTLAVVKMLPAIIYFRVFCPWLRIKCAFHSGPIYQKLLKDTVNRICVSAVSWFCHENVFVSKYVAKYWLTRGIVLSRPFRPLPRPSYELTKPPVVGFLGRISHEKDPELFLHIMDQVRSKTHIEVEIAGLGPLKAELEAKYPWAKWRGWVDGKAWLQTVDLLVTTSKTEGWPMAIGEALELGVPVIGTDVGGVPEILDGISAKWLTTTREEKFLSRMILNFLEHYENNSLNFFNELKKPQLTATEWALLISR